MLDSPRTEKEDFSYTSFTGLKTGSSGMQGWRLEMEDAHICCDMKSRPDHLLLAVFDGHGGSGAARFAASKLVDVIEANSTWKKYVADECDNLQKLSTALVESFIKLDNDLRVIQENNPHDQSGCTAVICMVTPHHIMCANSGDSRCVIGTKNVAKGLSEDHKPDDDSERRRIEMAGGMVSMSRVEGNLAVSRAFGDFEYKDRPDLPPAEQKVSCVPDIFLHRRSCDDQVLLLACDGLWDVMSNSDAIADVITLLEKGGEVKDHCSSMLDSALNKGSKDNISAVMADLRNSYSRDATMPAGLAESMEMKYGRFDYPKEDPILLGN